MPPKSFASDSTERNRNYLRNSLACNGFRRIVLVNLGVIDAHLTPMHHRVCTTLQYYVVPEPSNFSHVQYIPLKYRRGKLNSISDNPDGRVLPPKLLAQLQKRLYAAGPFLWKNL